MLIASNSSINTSTKQNSQAQIFPTATRIYYEAKLTKAYYDSTYYNNANEQTYPSLVLLTSAKENFANAKSAELASLPKTQPYKVLSAYVDIPANTYFKIEIRHNYRYREKERYLAGFRGWRTVWHNRHSVSLNPATNIDYFLVSVC